MVNNYFLKFFNVKIYLEPIKKLRPLYLEDLVF